MNFMAKKKPCENQSLITKRMDMQERDFFEKSNAKIHSGYKQVNLDFNPLEKAKEYKDKAICFPFEIARVHYKMSDYLNGKTSAATFIGQLEEGVQAIISKAVQGEDGKQFKEIYKKQIASVVNLEKMGKKYLNSETSIQEFNAALENAEF